MRPFYYEIREFVLIFQLCGLCPVGQTNSQNMILKLYAIVSIFLILVMFISAYFIFDMIEETSMSMTMMVETLVFDGQIITHVVTIIQSYQTKFQQSEFFEKIEMIDNELNMKLKYKINYFRMRQKNRIKFGAMTFLIFSLNGYFYTVVIHSLNRRQLVYWLHILYSTIVLRFRYQQHIFYIDLVYDRFKIINKILKRISDDPQTFTKSIVTIDLGENKLNSRYQGYKDLRTIKELYGRIWRLTHLINACFGWSALAMVTQTFLDFISHGYFLFTGLDHNKSIAGTICMLLPVIMLLSLLCFSCFSCINEVSIYLEMKNLAKYVICQTESMTLWC